MPPLRKPRTSARKHIARAIILVAVLNLVYTVVTRAADLPAVFRGALRCAAWRVAAPACTPACLRSHTLCSSHVRTGLRPEVIGSQKCASFVAHPNSSPCFIVPIAYTGCRVLLLLPCRQPCRLVGRSRRPTGPHRPPPTREVLNALRGTPQSHDAARVAICAVVKVQESRGTFQQNVDHEQNILELLQV